MAQRTCSESECDRPHWARGLCSSHYGAWHRKVNGRTRNAQTFPIVCIVCGAGHQAARRESKFCSDACKGRHYSETMRRKSKLPPDHPVMLLIGAERERRAAAKREAQRSKFEWRTARECPGCACWFTPLHTPNAVCCSVRCSRKMSKRRRRAREHNTLNDWRWSDFMRIARKFDYRCAYCGDRPGPLEPDHVIPLSRGGTDTVSNLLPACHLCNADKNARTLAEWAVWRQRKGKSPRQTSWTVGDARYAHLTDTLLIPPAA